MSMLSSQANELRDRAKVLRQGNWSDGADDAALMEQAADTIEQLREKEAAYMDANHEQGMRLIEQDKRIRELENRLQAVGETSYDAGFDNGMKAVLQQLDGLVHEGANVGEIQGWIDRQWEEEV